MAQQIINVGTTANDGTGDLLRNGFIKVNQNFTELYTNRISGSGTDNYIPRFNGTNALENSIIFDNGTNIGIGTTSPLGILHLYKSAATTRMLLDGDAGQSKIITYRTGGLQRFGMYLNNTAESGSNAGSDFQIRAYNDAGTLLSTPLFIKRSSGNVGIGTTSPTAKLTAINNASGWAGWIENQDTTGNGSGLVVTGASNIGGISLFVRKQDGTGTFAVLGNGNVGIGTTSPVDYQVFGYGANIENRGGRGGGFISTDSTATNRIVFSVDSSAGIGMIKSVTNTPLSFGVNDSEKMRITSSGNVGIGTTNPTEKLHVAGVAQILDDGSRGRITFQISSAQNDLFSTTTGFGAYRNLKLSSNELILSSGGTTERMRITSTGNVGIGTTSPAYSLEVNGSINVYPNNFFRYDGDTGIIGSATSIGGASNQLGIRASNDILFATNGANERMRITSSGNVGIGTTNPSARLHVIGGNLIATSISDVAVKSSFRIDTANPAISLTIGYDGSDNVFMQSVNSQTNTIEPLLINPYGGNVGIGTASPSAKFDINDSTSIQQNFSIANDRHISIYADAYQSIINSVKNVPLVFRTFDTERMRITSGGDVFVGRTSNWVAVGADKGLGLFSSGAVYSVVENDNAALFSRRSSDGDLILFRRDTNTVGSISVTTTLTSYNVTSDYRLKQDFKNFNGLELLSKIKVYDFAWNVDNSRMNGVIAHELQEVVPYAVTGEKDGEQMQQVDYSKLVPILIQSIQELKEEIETLKNK